MKKFLICLTVASFAFTALFAQSDRYMPAMEKNVSALDSAQTPEQFQELGNNFQRIAEAEQTQWLPYYYAGYCQVILAFTQKDPQQIDAIDDKAEQDAMKADSLHPNDADVNCLLSMVNSARIMVDPQSRGMEYGPKSSAYLQKAMSIDSTNPRPYMLMGQSLLYTPAQYGGGKDKAKPYLEQAVEKFKTFQPASSIAPNWGKEYADSLLTRVQ